MRVTKIEATKTEIIISVSAPVSALEVRERAPVINKNPGRELSRHAGLRFPRFEGARDRIFSEFAVYAGNERIPGVKYVTDMPEVGAGFLKSAGIKTLHATSEDVKILGVRQTTYNISLPAVMTLSPKEGDITFAHDGREFYFKRDKIERIDREIGEYAELGVNCTLILLNSPKLFGSNGERELLEVCLHPNYDWDSPDAFISAFNMRTEDGISLYRAFVDFLVERYQYAVPGMIISNEVDSQYVWGNAGEMSVAEYAREYAQAMRQAWLCAVRRNSGFRIYMSLDHFWNKLTYDVRKPERFYPGRDMIDNVAATAREVGDFPWHVAHHPYPEDLRWPDFWHDRTTDFTFSTPRVTFKNMEVLPAYLASENLLYRGQPRRIIFSEQGFNSHSGKLQGVTEDMARAGYVLAYLKARNIETCDMLMHHSYTDNPHEFGLNLGIRRHDPDKYMSAGAPKPIYESVRLMDTSEEYKAVEWARNYIGAELFDYLLAPDITRADRDASADSEFG